MTSRCPLPIHLMSSMGQFMVAEAVCWIEIRRGHDPMGSISLEDAANMLNATLRVCVCVCGTRPSSMPPARRRASISAGPTRRKRRSWSAPNRAGCRAERG